jgi:2-polyprenyl-6-methoxyphenol hydroxylase-like FAD-dependent oxidoreductase
MVVEKVRSVETIHTTCCIAGGGPAGMMLGFLLARAGIDVVVLEKHKDFLRDFRGDTIHPSTLELIYELGLLDEFLKLPHQKVETVGIQIGDEEVTLGDLRYVPTHCKFIAFMPQWDFLDFLADQGRRYKKRFDLRMRAEATALIERHDRVVGLRAKTPRKDLEIYADLVVGCDGRHSDIRRLAGLQSEDYGAPMDVLWFRLSRKEGDRPGVFGRAEAGVLLVMLDRGDYWQCAFVIPKDGLESVKAAGLEAFRTRIAEIAPAVKRRVGEIASWDDVKLLTVSVDRLRQWHRPGLLCLGDAAHAMSPVGGVGINLAIQDAVAAANILAEPLRAGEVSGQHLHAIEKRRLLPVKLTQAMQLTIQKRIIGRVLMMKEKLTLPWPFRLFRMFPVLRRIPARIIGVGFRPEHVRTPEVPVITSRRLAKAPATG